MRAHIRKRMIIRVMMMMTMMMAVRDNDTIAGGAQLSDWLSQETMRLHLRVHRPPE